MPDPKDKDRLKVSPEDYIRRALILSSGKSHPLGGQKEYPSDEIRWHRSSFHGPIREGRDALGWNQLHQDPFLDEYVRELLRPVNKKEERSWELYAKPTPLAPEVGYVHPEAAQVQRFIEPFSAEQAIRSGITTPYLSRPTHPGQGPYGNTVRMSPHGRRGSIVKWRVDESRGPNSGRYSRNTPQQNPNMFFVFGDNLQRSGTGGQAVIRNNPNVIGIPTKVAPGTGEGDYFDVDPDKPYAQPPREGRLETSYMGTEYTTPRQQVDSALMQIEEALSRGFDVAIPWGIDPVTGKEGALIGSGLADLHNKSPELYAHIQNKINQTVKVSEDHPDTKRWRSPTDHIGETPRVRELRTVRDPKIFPMDIKMSAKDNVTGKDTTALDLIKQGLRTSETRLGRDWASLKPGQVIGFKKNVNNPNEKPFYVKVTKNVTLDNNDNIGVIQQSDTEGWTVEAIRSMWESEGSQMRPGSGYVTFEPYDLEEGRKSVQREVDKYNAYMERSLTAPKQMNLFEPNVDVAGDIFVQPRVEPYSLSDPEILIPRLLEVNPPGADTPLAKEVAQYREDVASYVDPTPANESRVEEQRRRVSEAIVRGEDNAKRQLRQGIKDYVDQTELLSRAGGPDYKKKFSFSVLKGDTKKVPDGRGGFKEVPLTPAEKRNQLVDLIYEDIVIGSGVPTEKEQRYEGWYTEQGPHQKAPQDWQSSRWQEPVTYNAGEQEFHNRLATFTKSLDDTQAAGQRPLERFFNLSRSLGGIDTPEMEEVLSEERSYRAEDLTPGEQLAQAMEGDEYLDSPDDAKARKDTQDIFQEFIAGSGHTIEPSALDAPLSEEELNRIIKNIDDIYDGWGKLYAQPRPISSVVGEIDPNATMQSPIARSVERLQRSLSSWDPESGRYVYDHDRGGALSRQLETEWKSIPVIERATLRAASITGLDPDRAGDLLHEIIKHPKGRLESIKAFGRMVGQADRPSGVEPAKGYAGVTRVHSGGQAGADIYGLAMANKIGIETGGVAPKGFQTVKGPQAEALQNFGLTELSDKELKDFMATATSRPLPERLDDEGRKPEYIQPESVYNPRTELNVARNDATVYFGGPDGEESSGYQATKKHADEWYGFNKKFLYIEDPSSPAEQAKFRDWLIQNNVKNLNVAGSREFTDKPGMLKFMEIAKNPMGFSLPGEGEIKANISRAKIKGVEPTTVNYEDVLKKLRSYDWLSSLTPQQQAQYQSYVDEGRTQMVDAFRERFDPSYGTESAQTPIAQVVRDLNPLITTGLSGRDIIAQVVRNPNPPMETGLGGRAIEQSVEDDLRRLSNLSQYQAELSDLESMPQSPERDSLIKQYRDNLYGYIKEERSYDPERGEWIVTPKERIPGYAEDRLVRLIESGAELPPLTGSRDSGASDDEIMNQVRLLTDSYTQGNRLEQLSKSPDFQSLEPEQQVRQFLSIDPDAGLTTNYYIGDDVSSGRYEGFDPLSIERMGESLKPLPSFYRSGPFMQDLPSAVSPDYGVSLDPLISDTEAAIRLGMQPDDFGMSMMQERPGGAAPNPYGTEDIPEENKNLRDRLAATDPDKRPSWVDKIKGGSKFVGGAVKGAAIGTGKAVVGAPGTVRDIAQSPLGRFTLDSAMDVGELAKQAQAEGELTRGAMFGQQKGVREALKESGKFDQSLFEYKTITFDPSKHSYSEFTNSVPVNRYEGKTLKDYIVDPQQFEELQTLAAQIDNYSSEELGDLETLKSQYTDLLNQAVQLDGAAYGKSVHPMETVSWSDLPVAAQMRAQLKANQQDVVIEPETWDVPLDANFWLPALSYWSGRKYSAEGLKDFIGPAVESAADPTKLSLAAYLIEGGAELTAGNQPGSLGGDWTGAFEGFMEQESQVVRLRHDVNMNEILGTGIDKQRAVAEATPYTNKQFWHLDSAKGILTNTVTGKEIGVGETGIKNFITKAANTRNYHDELKQSRVHYGGEPYGGSSLWGDVLTPSNYNPFDLTISTENEIHARYADREMFTPEDHGHPPKPKPTREQQLMRPYRGRRVGDDPLQFLRDRGLVETTYTPYRDELGFDRFGNPKRGGYYSPGMDPKYVGEPMPTLDELKEGKREVDRWLMKAQDSAQNTEGMIRVAINQGWDAAERYTPVSRSGNTVKIYAGGNWTEPEVVPFDRVMHESTLWEDPGTYAVKQATRWRSDRDLSEARFMKRFGE